MLRKKYSTGSYLHNLFRLGGVFVLLEFGVLNAANSGDTYPKDPLSTYKNVPTSASKSMFGDASEDPCNLLTPSNPLRLVEAIEYALCFQPKTRTAWANTKSQAALVGQAKAAYLPTLQASGSRIWDHNNTALPDMPDLDSKLSNDYSTTGITMNWLLMDFGARTAAWDNATALLAAATANHDLALQTVFAATAKDYFAAQAAQENAITSRQTEANAKDVMNAAIARVTGGVAPISDQYQAQTAYAQAVIARTKAEGEQQTAFGALAIDMGFAPNKELQPLTLTDAMPPIASAMQPVDDLLKEAADHHPSLVAANQQLDAAIAKKRQVVAQGMPSLSFTAKRNRSSDPMSLGVGLSNVDAMTNDRYFGIELDVPLFEGFARSYQIRSAEADIEVKAAAVTDAEQQVALAVWNSYQTLKFNQENLYNTDMLLQIAQTSFVTADERYQHGVGQILELLNTQTALANARQQRVQALADWNNARMQLAASLGKLDISFASQP